MLFNRPVIASIIIISTMLCLRYLSHGENVQPKKPFSTFPKRIGEWVGKEDRFDQKIYDQLGVDDSLLCSYLRPDGRQIVVYVGFYQSQREGDLIHSPKNCMPGAGWNILNTSVEEVAMAGRSPQNMKVIKLVIQKGLQRQIVLYWFQSRGRYIASEYMQKVFLVVDAIKRHRTDGSFVRLISPVFDGDESYTEKYLKHFVKMLVPVLEEYIPS